jgi:hypothetical protein
MNKHRDLQFIELIAAALLGSFIVLLLGPYLVPTIFVKHDDTQAIDIASTFIAYIALIVGLATIILTVLGIWFTYWFSAEKAEILKDTTKHLAHQIAINPDQRASFFKHIIELLNENDLREVKSDFIEQIEAISEEKRKEYEDSLRQPRARKKPVTDTTKLNSLLEK